MGDYRVQLLCLLGLAVSLDLAGAKQRLLGMMCMLGLLAGICRVSPDGAAEQLGRFQDVIG